MARLTRATSPDRYTGWHGTPNVRLASFSSDAGATWSSAQAVPELVDWQGAVEGSVSGDPGNRRLYFVHPDSHERANLTVWLSTDDARSWGDLAFFFGVRQPASLEAHGTVSCLAISASAFERHESAACAMLIAGAG